jgi:peptide/nickel transport system ATP-binding protein
MADLLRLDAVTKHFVRRPGFLERAAALFSGGARESRVQAVTDVSVSVAPGEWVGLVGESGCGKSTLGRLAAGVHVPDHGAALLEGARIATADGGRVRKLTTATQMIHQDPFASLNPRIRVGETIMEGPIAHGFVARRDAVDESARWLSRVGLDPAYASRLPHQFSGGQRQRIAIARALALKPKLLVCDEPVASLDVSIQAQVINLFLDLRRDLGQSALFISHDLGVVRHLCDRIAIMYLGRIVEQGPAQDVTAQPHHPYTQALMEAVPRVAAAGRGFRPISGEIPSPLAPPSGCAFHPRCPRAAAICRTERPPLRDAKPGRAVACHLV